VFPFVGPALRRLNEAEWRTVVITNQPVLARGEADETELRRIHARLDSEVARDQAFFDRLYYCPHHPDIGFPGEVPALKINCDCRKPAPGLILRAASDLNLDLAESWFVGDSTADLGAAEAAGVSAILVETGNGGLDAMHPFEAGITQPNFAAAVDFILDLYPPIAAACTDLLAEMRPGEDWFVGGLARSGKSTLVAALLRELRRRGQTTCVIHLDRWIMSESERTSGVFGRFDMASLSDTLNQAVKRTDGTVALDLPAYSRRLKRSSPNRTPYLIPANATVIWEGVVAVELARRCGSVARTIQVETSEPQRKNRFHAYDMRRGLTQAASVAAWQARETDEHRPLRQLGKLATHKISLDGLLELNGPVSTDASPAVGESAHPIA
jgi:histidinol-phosphate phosphatase family protein